LLLLAQRVGRGGSHDHASADPPEHPQDGRDEKEDEDHKAKHEGDHRLRGYRIDRQRRMWVSRRPGGLEPHRQPFELRRSNSPRNYFLVSTFWTTTTADFPAFRMKNAAMMIATPMLPSQPATANSTIAKIVPIISIPTKAPAPPDSCFLGGGLGR